MAIGTMALPKLTFKIGNVKSADVAAAYPTALSLWSLPKKGIKMIASISLIKSMKKMEGVFIEGTIQDEMRVVFN